MMERCFRFPLCGGERESKCFLSLPKEMNVVRDTSQSDATPFEPKRDIGSLDNANVDTGSRNDKSRKDSTQGSKVVICLKIGGCVGEQDNGSQDCARSPKPKRIHGEESKIEVQ
ncbi:hypothetical protein SUGI_0927170 [Cryptomeria japonica]|nr:hypothetical protein SUGI_0927170 [Cryptomeria japonica]